jgi:hypothetical protein
MYYKLLDRPTEEMRQLLVDWGSSDELKARAAARVVVQALSLPLKQGTLRGDIIGDIYERQMFEPGQATEYPLDFISPGTEDSFSAYVVPGTGRIPERSIEADYVMVPTFMVGNSIDWPLRYAKHARWDIVGRALQALEGGFVLKNNRDGWHTIIAAAKARNLSVYDNDAPAGLFSKRLVALMETIMRRNAGGNSTSVSRGKLTDLYVSPEGKADMFAWDLTQVPDAVRTQIFTSGPLLKIVDVNIHDLDELGENQEFQKYFTSTLGASMPTDKLEIVVGLDLRNRDSFVNPVRDLPEIWEDMVLHRQNRAGMYARGEWGWGVLDNRRALIGAF